MAGRSVNKVILLGHLGRDAETRFTPGGTSVTNLRVATNRRIQDKATGEWRDETDWHSVTLWRAENLAQYLTKGKQVYIEGRLQTRSYDDKDGQKRYVTEVISEEIILLGGQGGGAGGPREGGEFDQSRPPVSMPRTARPAAPAQAHSQSQPPDDIAPGITDDDVPF